MDTPFGKSEEGHAPPPSKEEIAADPGKYVDTQWDITGDRRMPSTKWAGLVRDRRFGDETQQAIWGHPPTGEKYGMDDPDDPKEEPGAAGALNTWVDCYIATPKTAVLYLEGFGNWLGTAEKPVHVNWEKLHPKQRERMCLKSGEKVVNPW